MVKEDTGSNAKREISAAEIDAVLQKLGLAQVRPQKRRKTGWTVGELYKTVLPVPVWIVPELLPAGLASLAGRPKDGGP